MKLRTKLFLASASLVFLTSVVFFTISQSYLGGLFRNYAQATRTYEANQVAVILENYYYHANGSWDGAPQYLVNVIGQSGAAPQIDSLAVYDQQGQLQFQLPTRPQKQPSRNSADESHQGGSGTVTVSLQIGDQKIGTLEIRDRGNEGLYQLEQTVLHSASMATLWGTISTAVVALLMGAWFSRVLTKPLQRIVQGLRRIAAGNLDTKLSAISKDEFGEVAYAFNDMTEKLSRTEHARRHLVADVAHELRMPLTIMQGQLELIQQGVKPAVPETLLPIQDEVFRLTRLVQDLHQLSLAEVGKLSLVRESTNVVALLYRIADNFEAEFEDSGMEFRFVSNVPEDARIIVDADRITQVIVNLLGNAMRYTQTGGKVVFRADVEDRMVRIEVSDTGPGISEEHLAHIFDRFYRADTDRSRETGGTGLGLAIAKEFVEAHQGRIGVESRVGEGTTFTVWLPLHDEKTDETAPRNPSNQEQ